MSQRVELEAIGALVALAEEVVRLLDAVADHEQVLHDLRAVVLSGEHDGRDVGRELSVVGAGRLPERVGGAVDELLLVEYLVLRMVEYEHGDVGVAHVDGEQQCVAHLARVALGQQQLHALDVLAGDGQAQRRPAQVVRHVDVELLDVREYLAHRLVVAHRARVDELVVDGERRAGGALVAVAAAAVSLRRHRL